jgi:type IX secretion system PorP/SprF family membrane protein
MKKILLLTLTVITVSVTTVWSQQDPLFTHYMFNKLYYNPGYAGINGDMDFSLTYRNQWVGYESSFDDGGAPGTALFSMSAPVYYKKLEGGLGGLLVVDQYGFTQDIQFQITPSYFMDLGPGKIGFGLKLGGIYKSVDFTKVRVVDENDNLIPLGAESRFGPDLGLGVWYESQKYFGGFGINHLIPTKFDFGLRGLSVGGETPAENKLVPHYNLTGGVNIEANYELKITPSFIVQSANFDQTIWEVNAMATYQDRFWGGVSYRSSSDLIALVGMGFLEDNVLKIGLAFDFGLDARKNEALKPVSPEVFVTYKIPSVGARKKPIVRTPRYRF